MTDDELIITCDVCGRKHIPDPDDPTQQDTCYECQTAYGDEN